MCGLRAVQSRRMREDGQGRDPPPQKVPKEAPQSVPKSAKLQRCYCSHGRSRDLVLTDPSILTFLFFQWQQFLALSAALFELTHKRLKPSHQRLMSLEVCSLPESIQSQRTYLTEARARSHHHICQKCQSITRTTAAALSRWILVDPALCTSNEQLVELTR